MIDPTLMTGITAALTFVSGLAVARMQSRGQTGTRTDARISTLEGQLDKANTALAETRDKYAAERERLMEEEEVLRDQHAAKLLAARERGDDLRIQNMAMRAELLGRGVNPDRLLGEPVLTAAA